MAITRVGTTSRWSDIVIYNGLLYTVEVPTNTRATLAEQSIEVLTLIERSLTQHGSSKSYLLSVTIYLQDIQQIDIFNQVWESWLPEGCAPVRACVEAKLASAAGLVEVQVVAALL